VHLVDEEDRLLAGPGEQSTRRVDRGTHLLHTRGHRGDLDEEPVGLTRDDRGDGGLAGAGRSPEQQRHRLVTLDEATQRRTVGEQVPLPRELVQGARPHPYRERRGGVGVAGQRAA